MKKIQISKWHLYNIAKTAILNNNLDKIFFTNNIMESANSRLNINIIKNRNNTIIYLIWK